MHIHLIGVAGTAMATLAAMLQRRGHRVTGSDAGVYPPMSDFLRSERIEVYEGYDALHVDPAADLVVVGNAISRGNPELEAVLSRRQRYCSLPERIRDEFLWERQPIVIAGTHGKTTTTSMVAWVLTYAGLDPSLLVGGIAANFEASYRLGSGRDFVIEGDEYDSAFFDKTAKFLKYVPETVVINNVEFDHADIYPDVAAILTAFTRLLRLVPATGRVFIGADDAGAASLVASACGAVETFGLSEGANWQARDLRPGPEGTTFEVWRQPATGNGQPAIGTPLVNEPHQRLGTAMVPMTGLHNVRNALAAIAVAASRGVPLPTIVEGLATFAGVKRRMELRGVQRGVSVYDDFAHHPTAIAETLRGVRRAHPDARIWAIFEPRSASSCLRVFHETFAGAFADADEVVLSSVFRMNLPEEKRLSVPELVRDLVARGQRARHIATTAAIVETVAQEAREGDLVVVMSNGGFDDIHARLLDALRADSAGPGMNWRLEFLGDAALSVHPVAEAPLEANGYVHRLAQRLRHAQVTGVRDIVPGMQELVVHVDPLRCHVAAIEAALRAGHDTATALGDAVSTVVTEIPVDYGGDAGPDLDDVAMACGLTPADVCRRHAATEYVVCFLGFLPGFPYLGPLDPLLHMPRRRAPRQRVPPGSVAIAGDYTGVYPWASPGGWHLIGRTDLSLFDLDAVPPARLAPGARVRFVAR